MWHKKRKTRKKWKTTKMRKIEKKGIKSEKFHRKRVQNTEKSVKIWKKAKKWHKMRRKREKIRKKIWKKMHKRQGYCTSSGRLVTRNTNDRSWNVRPVWSLFNEIDNSGNSPHNRIYGSLYNGTLSRSIPVRHCGWPSAWPPESSEFGSQFSPVSANEPI